MRRKDTKDAKQRERFSPACGRGELLYPLSWGQLAISRRVVTRRSKILLRVLCVFASPGFFPDDHRRSGAEIGSSGTENPEPRTPFGSGSRGKRSGMPVQPRTPPGVLELLPLDQIAFQRMLDAIRRNFERFGFLPVETPVMELTDVLLTKTGGETERQVYFVQSTGALEQGETAGAGAALRSHRAARALRRRARARAHLPVPPLPDPARVPRRARAARPLPRVLPVRHRRDRQGHAVGALRRRDAGGDLRRVPRARDRAVHDPASTTAS